MNIFSCYIYTCIFEKLFYEDKFQSTEVKKHQLTCIHLFVIMKKFERECQNKLFFFAGIWDTKVHDLSLKERRRNSYSASRASNTQMNKYVAAKPIRITKHRSSLRSFNIHVVCARTIRICSRRNR